MLIFERFTTAIFVIIVVYVCLASFSPFDCNYIVT